MPCIFLLQEDGELTEMNEQPYLTEGHLQQLVAKYPNLLASDQISSDTSACRWLLVKREIGIPSEEGGSNRWSLDHLFLDQDGIPTLVEVKRSSDSRIRREVVGQMLDYAANGVVHWPIDRIRNEFEKQCTLERRDASEVIASFLGDETPEEEFWQLVNTNLLAGKIRMLFVADKIPDELKRIVEFLNTQMYPAQVLAIEIRQFGSGSFKTLVPALFGQTAEAEQRKRGGPRSVKEPDLVRRAKALDFLKSQPGEQFTAGGIAVKTAIPKVIIHHLLHDVQEVSIHEQGGKRLYSYKGVGEPPV